MCRAAYGCAFHGWRDAAFTDRLITEVELLPSVTAVRANRRTQSLVVEYKKLSARSTLPTAMAQQLGRAIQDAAAGKQHWM